MAAALVAVSTIAPAAAQSPRPSPIFRLESDEFWLNLHHFLYALGRVEAKMSDATSTGVAAASSEAERGLRTH